MATSKEFEVLGKLTKYHQISKDSELKGKVIKYSDIQSFWFILVFTDQTFVYAESDGEFLDDSAFEGNLGLVEAMNPVTKAKGVSRLGEALDIKDLSPYHEYLHDQEAAREDQEYQEFLRLRAKYGYKDETNMA